jgi:glycosyltransferase involved in cell wall biosynthesis
MPDVIHFHWANPFPAAVLLTMIPKDIKLVIHWHMDIIKQAKIYPLIKPIEKMLLRRADMILVTSPNYRDGSIPLMPFKSKVRIVQSAMDESKFVLNENDNNKIIELKRKFGNKPIVFFVGRHIQYKGLPYLLSAEKYVKTDCVFIIAGGGPLTEELKNECHSDRVKFVGRISDQELKYYHYAASVFAFPSITKNEAFGVALAEAMYCYTPAVTFTIEGSGVNWVNLNGETGIEVPNCDIKAYAHAIDTLLSDPQLSNQYADAAHKRVVENFTIPRMMEKMIQFYNELLK